MTLKTGQQLLKTRDDHAPVLLISEAGAQESDKPFKLQGDVVCSWAKAGDMFGPERLRPRIEPWLTALVQSEHLSLLVGSGLTHALHRMATGNDLPGMSATPLGTFDDEVTREAKRTAELAGREKGNIEDQIRVASELVRGLEIIASTKPPSAPEHERVAALRRGLAAALGAFAASILYGERNLVSAAAQKREQSFNYLVRAREKITALCS
jgi:hypothetical protein